MLRNRITQLSILVMVLVILLACRQSVQPLTVPTIIYRKVDSASTTQSTQQLDSTAVTSQPTARQPDDPTIETPTPDKVHQLPALRSEDENYVVQGGDSLGSIADRYMITVPLILKANEIADPDYLEVGQEIVLPAPIPGDDGTSFKIIPDSEMVYGPMAQSLDVSEFVGRYDSFLGRYEEVVEGQTLSGPEVVNFVAHDYSVNPRLLLAVLEYQSGWVTQANPDAGSWEFPIGVMDYWRKGLYFQLAWAADNLNLGYYLWKAGSTGGWILSDGTAIPIDPTINAGTAAVQRLFSLLYDREDWDHAVSRDGFFSTYSKLFGYPFDYAYEPVIPEDLEQPTLQLPFEPGVDWAFTGGPHGGWGAGSAWAALDFAPGMQGFGCQQSNFWVVASADGLIIRADQGRVIQDLDNDGNEGTGWIILYMHIEASNRVEAGTYLKAGDRIGHPSCEGGYSTGTHTHLARRYNGEWIPADQDESANGSPFILDGWVSSGYGVEYNGYLDRDGESIVAWEGFAPANTIHR